MQPAPDPEIPDDPPDVSPGRQEDVAEQIRIAIGEQGAPANEPDVTPAASPSIPQPRFVARRRGPVERFCSDVAYGVRHFDVPAAVTNQAVDTAVDFFLPGYASRVEKVTKGLVVTPEKDRRLFEQAKKIEELENENADLKRQLLQLTDALRQVSSEMAALGKTKMKK